MNQTSLAPLSGPGHNPNARSSFHLTSQLAFPSHERNHEGKTKKKKVGGSPSRVFHPQLQSVKVNENDGEDYRVTK